MKYVLTLLVLILCLNVQAQKVGDYDVMQRATDSLIVDVNFMKSADTIVPLLDIAYFEFSADGTSFRKNYVLGDTWARYSGYAKLDWDTIRFMPNYWILQDSVLYTNPEYVNRIAIDTITADTLYAVYANGDINADYYFIEGDSLTLTNIYNSNPPRDSMVLVSSADTAIWIDFPTGVGQTNVMENVGTTGIGFYDNKDGVKFNMRNLAAPDSYLDLTLDENDSIVLIEFVPSQLVVNTGVGLTGGGNLASNLTLNFNIPTGLPESPAGAIDGDADWIALYDADSTIHYKIHPEQFLEALDTSYFRVFGDTGSDTPDRYRDSIYFIGAGDVTTSVSGDTVTISASGVGCNTSTQTLTSGTDTLNVSSGVNGTLDIGSNTTIRIELSSTCNTGNISVATDASGYTIQFLGDYPIWITPCLTHASGVITTTASASVDVFSYWFDGSRIIINGTQDYVED